MHILKVEKTGYMWSLSQTYTRPIAYGFGTGKILPLTLVLQRLPGGKKQGLTIQPLKGVTYSFMSFDGIGNPSTHNCFNSNNTHFGILGIVHTLGHLCANNDEHPFLI